MYVELYISGCIYIHELMCVCLNVNPFSVKYQEGCATHPYPHRVNICVIGVAFIQPPTHPDCNPQCHTALTYIYISILYIEEINDDGQTTSPCIDRLMDGHRQREGE